VEDVLFLPDSHQYFVGGVELPSVTHICRFLSVDIADGAKPWMRDAAAQRGTIIHAACESIDYGLDPDGLTPETTPYTIAYLDFLRDYRITGWAGIEVIMGSRQLGYAGTADRIGWIDGKLVILDIKTGSTLHTQPLAAQLTGYAKLYRFQAGRFPDALYGLHLKKDGTYTLREVTINHDLWASCVYLNNAIAPKRRKKLD